MAEALAGVVCWRVGGYLGIGRFARCRPVIAAARSQPFILDVLAARDPR
jgi:hypothetical protein